MAGSPSSHTSWLPPHFQWGQTGLCPSLGTHKTERHNLSLDRDRVTKTQLQGMLEPVTTIFFTEIQPGLLRTI